MQKNYSFTRVVFLLFQSKIANLFYSKTNGSGGVKTTGFASNRSGFESLSCQKFPCFHWLLSEVPEISETLKGSSTNFFGTETKNRRGNVIFALLSRP